MKNNRKLLIILLILCIFTSLIGCGSVDVYNYDSTAPEKPRPFGLGRSFGGEAKPAPDNEEIPVSETNTDHN